MPAVTLLQKAYGAFSPKTLELMLKFLLKDLKIHVEIKERTVHEWVQIEVKGEDEAVALQFLDKEMGLAPTNVEKVGKFSVLGGRIAGSDKPQTALRVDVGVFVPTVFYASVSLQRLQAQLADGKKLSLQSLMELYSLRTSMPIEIKIVDAQLSGEKEAFEAELSEQQLGQFTGWLRSSMDRLLVFGARHQDVERAIEASKHFRDVIRIESFGWLEHAILCKLGTDAVGLIPALGRFLPKATFAPFSSRKILQVVNRPSL